MPGRCSSLAGSLVRQPVCGRSLRRVLWGRSGLRRVVTGVFFCFLFFFAFIFNDEVDRPKSSATCFRRLAGGGRRRPMAAVKTSVSSSLPNLLSFPIHTIWFCFGFGFCFCFVLFCFFTEFYRVSLSFLFLSLFGTGFFFFVVVVVVRCWFWMVDFLLTLIESPPGFT